MACLRHRSAVFTPASCSFRIAMICSSECLLRFIVWSPPEGGAPRADVVVGLPWPTTIRGLLSMGSWIRIMLAELVGNNIMNYTKPERLSLKLHNELDEKWIQKLIADDPKILGLGELVLRDRERIQRRAGRLDLLLQDPDTKRRYEVELQLGATDEAHIIRTIEYWDIERKRYPQYEHCAVIIAEDITSRFLNVVSLFNGTVPLVAIQMQAFMIGENLTLIFTTVVDELSRGVVEEDEDAEAAPTDRSYWESKGSKNTVAMA